MPRFKRLELVRVARREGQEFDCAPWVHKASSMRREEFEQEVERHLTGHETEPHEILYFKVYKSQLFVIERALETAGLLLGSNKSRGYCLEMICADFSSGGQPGPDSAIDLIMQSSKNPAPLRQREPRLKLSTEEYAKVRNRVL
jgi:hypothetical protein